MKQRKRRIMAILLAFAMIFTMVDPSIFGGTVTVQAEESSTVPKGWNNDKTIYYVGDSGNLEYIANHYADENEEGEALRNAKYEMTSNIKLGTSAANGINIGTSKYPFKNEFDGHGYTIYGLVYNDQIATMGGLFSLLDGAIIKNLIIDGAVIRSNQYGGVLAAQAQNSVIQNVTIINSKCKIASLGAIVGLVTTGGLYGGALVGYAGGTKFYNCESRGTEVYVDTTGGVQALGGDGMYMGGLVGWMDNGSILEYSRVIEGKVSTEYYVAVGALAANNLYAGGVVGRIDGNYTDLDGNEYEKSQILDCFSSAEVSYDGDCYVSVAAGLSGFAGGIAARVSGENYEIARCHFAGKLSGSLLNAILVLPILAMEDYYLGGVAGQVENHDKDQIHNCYFNWENAIKDNSYPGGPKVPAIWGESNTGDITTIGREQYGNYKFFVTFDFDGTEKISTGNAEPFNGEHSNKWVIDPVSNMPVHGKRVEASMDFPGAGTITFAETSIQPAQTTDTNEKNISQIAQVHADMNEALTLTATVNEGYNFKGWYKDGTLVAGTEESPDLTLTLGGESGLPYGDNDIYEAKYTTNVIFKDITADGDISKEYTYNQSLDELIPEDPVLNNYVFLGWSADSTKNFLDESSEYYRDNLTSTDIDNSWFVNVENPVTGSLTLYPVFIRIDKYNVKVQMETYELYTGTEDNSKHTFGQEGEAKVLINENGQLYITVDENPEITEENGYRFDGWYENGECVSTNKIFYNVDLSTSHTYEARYQYRVTAYIPIKVNDTYMRYGVAGGKVGDYYVGYNKGIDSIPEPSFRPGYATFKGWVTKDDIRWDQDYLVDTFITPGINSIQIPSDPIIITKPTIICAVPTISSSSVSVYYPISIRSDFPYGVSNPSVEDNDIISFKLEDGYNLLKLTQYDRKNYDNEWDRKDISLEATDWNGATVSKQIDSGGRSETILLAQLSANINFYNYDGTKLDDDNNPETAFITRTYNSKLFNTDSSETTIDPTTPETPDYVTPGNSPVGTGITPTDESMYRNGYKFIGWTTDESIFIDKEDYVVSSEAAVSGSLLDKNTRVTETMDVYPVYLKYDITFETNFGESGPEGSIVESTKFVEEEGNVIFKFTGDGYEFADPDEWTVKENGLEIDATIIKNGDNTYTIKGLNTETGYEIIASCTATVTFNNENGSEVKKAQYDYNQELGELPKPTQEVNSSETSISAGTTPEVEVEIFAGWKENSEYVTDKTLVTAPMNLHPEYVAPPSLECTIDDSDTKIVVSKTGTATLVTSKEEGYEFAGWKWTANGESSIITVLPNEDGTYKYELTPEQARKGGTYTAQFNPIIKYMIPIIEEDKITGYTELVESISYNRILNNENAETATAVLKVLESLRGTPYVFEGITDENNQIWSWSETKCVDDSGKLQEQTPYKENVDSTIVVYPIISEEEDTLSAKIFSNLEDGEEVAIDLVRENGKITLPEDPNDLPEGLVVNCAKGINDAEVEAQFVGYSLVSITTTNDNIEISRTSDALYAPGDTIYVDQIESYATTATKVTDKGNKVTARIYAVWAQVQNISGARMYFGGGTPSFSDGLISAVAVNTEILSRAGLQNGQTCSYKRSVEYHLGKNKITAVVGQSDIWDNDLYKMYFDKSFNTNFSQNSWNIYTSVTTNLKEKFYSQKISISPYLTFVYTKTDFNSKIDGNVYVEENTVTQYSYNEVASELLRLSEDPENQCYEWAKEEHKEQLKKFAGN